MAIHQDVREDINGNVYVNLNDGSGNALTSTTGALDVNVANANGVEVFQATHDDLNANANIQVGDTDVSNGNPVPISDAGGTITVDGSVTVSATNLDIRDIDNAQDDILVYGWDGAANQKIKTDAGGELQVDVLSSALPSGAATESTLSAISGKLSPATPTLAQVALSATSVTILASSASRKGFIVVNDSNRILYLAFGATATTSAYTVKLQPNTMYESPTAVYTGVISGIWASAGTGNAVVTSLA